MFRVLSRSELSRIVSLTSAGRSEKRNGPSRKSATSSSLVAICLFRGGGEKGLGRDRGGEGGGGGAKWNRNAGKDEMRVCVSVLR